MNPDRYNSGEWVPPLIVGSFINFIVVYPLLYGVVLFRAHADEHRGLFFTLAAMLVFAFLARGGEGCPYLLLAVLADALYWLTAIVGVPVCILKIDKAHTTAQCGRGYACSWRS